jgi:hypothetical protein
VPANTTHPGSGPAGPPWPPLNPEPTHRSDDRKMSLTPPPSMDEKIRGLADAMQQLPSIVFERRGDTAAAAGPDIPPWGRQLRDWWVETTTRDIELSLGKIVEYGGSGAAYDLIATGRDLAAMNGREVNDREATELGIMFYLSSKVNRWMAAAIDGRTPSDDTLLDIVYYGMMARRNRAAGGWPVA